MGATNYTELLARLRVESDDTADSKLKLGDTPQGTRDASNVIFRLSATNIVTTSLKLTYGATVRSAAGFTVLDAISGYIQMTAAPDTTTQPFFFDYSFQYFTDADMMKFLDGGTVDLGGVAGTDLDVGLYSAQVQFALARFWKRRASTYANQYATAGGGASASPESVTAQFLSLAKAATSEGVRLMNVFYTRHGARQAPASGTITARMDPYTPRR
ncbi:MAG: hypothetical protein WC822_06995 [Candidatus Paceibacterota bacterium]|jgi:hypothetical protein